MCEVDEVMPELPTDRAVDAELVLELPDRLTVAPSPEMSTAGFVGRTWVRTKVSPRMPMITGTANASRSAA